MSSSPLLQLADQGQSVWLDNISRDLLTSGGLEKLRKRGIRGVTSNPTIFQKAISETSHYDRAIERMAKSGSDVKAIYESLAIEDIRAACDVLKPTYEETKGLDGYVSLEVSPDLAYDGEATLAEAKRLFAEIARPNVMIKIPGTPEGVPAIRDAIAAGLNINVTLLFSVKAHEQVIDAYIEGLQMRAKNRKPLHTIASVASFFVSRVDSAIDKQLDEKAKKAGSPAEAEKLRALRGLAAIENARLAYGLFRKMFGAARFKALAAKGAQVQRPLWASTSTKNPEYRDVLYCEQLIGPNTVNTMPPATIEAFDDHGVVAKTLPGTAATTRERVASLAAAGIDMDAVCRKLVEDGVKSFAQSFTDLLAGIDTKRKQLASSR